MEFLVMSYWNGDPFAYTDDPLVMFHALGEERQRMFLDSVAEVLRYFVNGDGTRPDPDVSYEWEHGHFNAEVFAPPITHDAPWGTFDHGTFFPMSSDPGDSVLLGYEELTPGLQIDHGVLSDPFTVAPHQFDPYFGVELAPWSADPGWLPGVELEPGGTLSSSAAGHDDVGADGGSIEHLGDNFFDSTGSRT
jgi:hypothetical protein